MLAPPSASQNPYVLLHITPSRNGGQARINQTKPSIKLSVFASPHSAPSSPPPACAGFHHPAYGTGRRRPSRELGGTAFGRAAGLRPFLHRRAGGDGKLKGAGGGEGREERGALTRPGGGWGGAAGAGRASTFSLLIKVRLPAAVPFCDGPLVLGSDPGVQALQPAPPLAIMTGCMALPLA